MGSKLDIDSLNIPYGNYDVPFDIKPFIDRIPEYREQPRKKISGLELNNYFIDISKEDKIFLGNELNKMLDKKFDWNFEFFHSGEPVNLHTDYTTIPWDDETVCHVVVGCIIPLNWNCAKIPYTINYENMQLEPRKMMFRKDDMIYLDTKEAFKYRQEFPMWDKRVLKHHPNGTEYFDTYGDMRWHSEFEWERGRMILFDTRRWHSSSWWTTSSDIIPNSPEYKESLTGFGSVDVPRN